MFSPFHQIKLIVVVLLNGALLGQYGSCSAQEAKIRPESNRRIRRPESKRVCTIAVKNVPVDLMAFWLDPETNPTPAAFKPPGQQFQAGPIILSGGIDMGLFEGVDSVLAVESQSAVLVFGTTDGIKRVEKRVTELDKHYPQVEIRGQYFQMSPEDAISLGFVWRDPGDTAEMRGLELQSYLGVIRPDIQARLDAMVKQGNATILSTSRAVALNNLPVSIGATKVIPAPVSVQGKGGQSKTLPKEGAFLLVSSPEVREAMSQFMVNPTVNNDDSITLFVNPVSTLAFSKRNKHNGVTISIALETLQGGAGLINIKDGQTVFLSGLTSRFFPGVKREKASASNVVVLLITSRIIKRATQ